EFRRVLFRSYLAWQRRRKAHGRRTGPPCATHRKSQKGRAEMILATLQSSAVLIVTLGFLLLLRKQSASVRHAVLSVGLLCALAAPLVGPFLPELPHTGAIYSEVRNQTEILWNLEPAVERIPAEPLS